MIALDLFAGTGWGVACKQLGIAEVGVDNWEPVIDTRSANGMLTVYRDVWDGLTGSEQIPPHDLLIASPPCQTFSTAGSGTGRKALTEVLSLLHSGAYLDPESLRAFGSEHDERTALVLTPLAYVHAARPMYVVFEQVPPVLPVWEACAEVLRGLGYSAVTGCLNTEQYGVPQTRRRAVMIARRDGVEARLPAPTHSKYYSRNPAKLDEGVLPWVPMSAMLDTEASSLRSNYGTGGDPANRGEREADQPAPTVTSKIDRNLWQFNDQSGTPFDPEWPSKRPATVVAGRDIVQNPGATANRYNGATKSRNDGVRVSIEQASLLQSYPADFRWAGSKSQIFQQIGNAVPPLLALHILRTFQ